MSLFPICIRPWTSFEIDDGRDCWGYVRPCCWASCHVSDDTDQSVDGIWNGPGYVNFRAHMLAGDLEGYCAPDCPNLTPSSIELRSYLGQLIRNPTRNHLLNLLEIVQGETVLRSVPINVKVAPTLACNLRCIMCYQTHDATRCLSSHLIESLLDILPQARFLQVQGGEVFAFKAGLDFLEHVAALRQAPAVGIITNGTFPINRGWDLLERLKLRWIMVSIDAACPETFRQIRVGGDWDTILTNIRRLCAQSRVRKPRFEVYLSCTLMTLNYREVPSLLELARSLGADVVMNSITPDSNTAYLDVMNQPKLHNEVRACLFDALAYASRARMPLARVSLRIMLDILNAVNAGDEEG